VKLLVVREDPSLCCAVKLIDLSKHDTQKDAARREVYPPSLFNF
jgi:hypothetical protein